MVAQEKVCENLSGCVCGLLCWFLMHQGYSPFSVAPISIILECCTEYNSRQSRVIEAVHVLGGPGWPRVDQGGQGVKSVFRACFMFPICS